jgi:hypothetical protein
MKMVQHKKTILLSDGATWIRNLCAEIFPDAQQIFHLCENVYTYAKYLFNMDESKYNSWADDICKALKKSDSNHVLTELAKLKDKKLANCSINL